MKHAHSMPFGAQLLAGGGVRFSLWAPGARRVALVLGEGAQARRIDASCTRDGWATVRVDDAGPGTCYRWRIDDELDVPDPASRFNPRDVAGPSEVIDPRAFEWDDNGWHGRPWHEAVVYELHVGTFTPEGTYEAARKRLAWLRELGVTAIELMPLADFPGRRGWGYDGVLPYAPDSAYGRPESLKALIRDAHRLGLSVLLDVVYNHFGPDGNYLGRYAPPFFTHAEHTPWGDAIGFHGAQSAVVRDFFVHNALYWLNEYRFDGLRFDAVHAIRDASDEHVLAEIARRVRAGVEPGRHVHLVLENDLNEARWLRGTYEAQWNDDYHHAAHVLATGERDGYYADYADEPARWLARCLAEGYAWQGEPSPYRNGETRGETSTGVAVTGFVDFLQNHDQIGNRAFGERIATLAPPERLAALATVTLLAPSVPMLFMGEEFGATTPFLYFCDHHGELGRLVTEGRRREFAGFGRFSDPATIETIPDPQAERTFAASKLDWSCVQQPAHAAVLERTRRLLELRRREIVPLIPAIAPDGHAWEVLGARAFEVRWRLRDGRRLRMAANLGDAAIAIARADAQRVIHRHGTVTDDAIGPDSVLLALESPEPSDSANALPALDTAQVPRATYRLQLHGGFGLAQACEIVPYLARLGVSHVYCSPLLKARPGSTHGYDVIDPEALNPELGDEATFDRFCDALRAHGLGMLLDIVPNHMGVHEADNPWWLDVLEHGAASRRARYFDIDWSPPMPGLRGRVLLPVLGDQYGHVLERGELRLAFDAGSGSVSAHYWNHRFPLDPRTYPAVLGGDAAAAALDTLERVVRDALADTVAAFAALPDRDAVASDDEREARAAQADAAKRGLARLATSHAEVRTAIDAVLERLNGRAGDAPSFDALDALLDAQPWRVAYWGMAADEINYRRFFDVTALAALRIESPEVFDAAHRRVLQWVEEGRVAGLRVDHPDGLRDPTAYFERLQREASRRLPAHDGARRAIYLVVEKILGEFERLRADWPVHGTTGYDYANLVNGLFVDAGNERRFDRLYANFTAASTDFADTLYRCKHLVLTHVLASERDTLTDMLWRIAQSDRTTRDYTRNRLRTALAEVIAAFPVYRSYVSERGAGEDDRRWIAWALAFARRRSRAAESTTLEFLREVLLSAASEPDAQVRALKLAFVARFQQVTSPVMAKGFEDTALYRYNRLVSLNDVGADPARFGVSVARFHAENQQRARTNPHSMLATSTHDTKRSEDVRARIDVLSEMPGAWRLALRRWQRMNRRWLTDTDEGQAPTRNDEYLLYQTLVGALPAGALDDAALGEFRERIQRYMLKAVREAKALTSWIDPNPDYEAAVAAFVDRLLGSVSPNPFLTDLRALVARVEPFARMNALAIALLKLTCPGVPDIYQGCESWSLALVDPDNRRPVDFAMLAARVAALAPRLSDPARERDVAELLARPGDGSAKTWVTMQCLAARAARPALYARGGYQPLYADGAMATHAVAFRRMLDDDEAIAVGTRLAWQLAGGDVSLLADGQAWEDTVLSIEGARAVRFVDRLTGRQHLADTASGAPTLRLREVLGVLPVALLEPITNDDADAATRTANPEG